MRLTIQSDPFLDATRRAYIEEGLNFFNMAVSGQQSYYPLCNVLTSDTGDVHGGVMGFVWGGWLQVTALWVSEIARGAGFGTQLLVTAEGFARQHDALGIALETYSFQARPFYERHGFEVFATIENYPIGHSKHFLRKLLAPIPPSRCGVGPATS